VVDFLRDGALAQEFDEWLAVLGEETGRWSDHGAAAGVYACNLGLLGWKLWEAAKGLRGCSAGSTVGKGRIRCALRVGVRGFEVAVVPGPY
jgi:hypothetical protein